MKEGADKRVDSFLIFNKDPKLIDMVTSKFVISNCLLYERHLVIHS